MPYTDFSKLPRELLNAQEWQPKAEESSTDGSSQPSPQRTPGIVTPPEPRRPVRNNENRPTKNSAQTAPVRRRKAKTPQEMREEVKALPIASLPVRNGRPKAAAAPAPPPPASSAPSRPRRQPVFDFVQDNAAKTAWRRGEAPAEKYTLYKPAEEVEDRGRMYDFLAELGVRCNSHITPPQTGSSQECLIYGNNKAVIETKRGISAWLRCLDEGLPEQRKATRNFAKESSTAGDKYMRNMKQIGRQARIRAFQQAPPDESSMEFHELVPWTMQDVSPRQIYGLNLEAFDNLRMTLQCFISFDDRQTLFRLSSNKEDAVQTAKDRITASSTAYVVRSKPCLRSLFCARPPDNVFMAGETLYGKPALVPILEAPLEVGQTPNGNHNGTDQNEQKDSKKSRTSARQAKNDDIVDKIGGAMRKGAKQANTKPKSLKNDVVPSESSNMEKTLNGLDNINHVAPATKVQDRNIMSENPPDEQDQNLIDQSMAHLSPLLAECISRLQHYSGRLSLKVVFGTFYLQTFKKAWIDQEMTSVEFRKTLALPTIRGSIHPQIIRNHPHAAWQRLVQQKSALISADPCILHLEHIRPEISAHFTVHQFERPSLLLHLDFARLGDEPYEGRSRDWSREDGSGQTMIMDSAMVCGGLSWSLIGTYQRALETSSIEPRMQAFAESVRVKEIETEGLEDAGSPILEWTISPNSIRPSALEQRRKYRYQLLQNTLWYLEICFHETFDARFAESSAMWWSATLRSSSWDAVLSENYSLAIGESATWPAEISTFFPEEGQSEAGMREMLRMATEARRILHAVFSD